jgi:hypothetical protein
MFSEEVTSLLGGAGLSHPKMGLWRFCYRRAESLRLSTAYECGGFDPYHKGVPPFARLEPRGWQVQQISPDSARDSLPIRLKELLLDDSIAPRTTVQIAGCNQRSSARVLPFAPHSSGSCSRSPCFGDPFAESSDVKIRGPKRHAGKGPGRTVSGEGPIAVLTKREVYCEAAFTPVHYCG